MPATSGGMSLGFVVETDSGPFVADVGRFRSLVSDLRPALGVVRENLYRAQERVFAGEGAVTAHGQWRPLSNRPWMTMGRLIRPGYSDWKRGIYRHRATGSGTGRWWAYLGPRGQHWPRVLSLSGRLHRSLTRQAPGGVWVAMPHGFVFGTRVASSKGKPYPLYHQRGMGRNPQRRFLDFDVRGPNRKLWVQAIIKPVQRFMRVGAESLKTHGLIDDTRDLTEESGNVLEGRGDG